MRHSEALLQAGDRVHCSGQQDCAWAPGPEQHMQGAITGVAGGRRRKRLGSVTRCLVCWGLGGVGCARGGLARTREAARNPWAPALLLGVGGWARGRQQRCKRGPIHPLRSAAGLLIGVLGSGPIQAGQVVCQGWRASFSPSPIELGCFPSSPRRPEAWYDLGVLEMYEYLGIGSGLSITGERDLKCEQFKCECKQCCCYDWCTLCRLCRPH